MFPVTSITRNISFYTNSNLICFKSYVVNGKIQEHIGTIECHSKFLINQAKVGHAQHRTRYGNSLPTIGFKRFARIHPRRPIVKGIYPIAITETDSKLSLSQWIYGFYIEL